MRYFIIILQPPGLTICSGRALVFIVGDVRELWPFLVALFLSLLQYIYNNKHQRIAPGLSIGSGQATGIRKYGHLEVWASGSMGPEVWARLA